MTRQNQIDSDGIFITEDHAFFYTNKCPFSNFYPTSFTYAAFGENHRFFTSEQAFMWHKAMLFNDIETAKKILQENTDPAKCKALGRAVRDYDDGIWSKARYDVFMNANLEKFTQDEKLKKFMLQDKFEGKHFVEASPYDGIWGIRMNILNPEIIDEKNWKGQNLLGKCLDEVRRKIKSLQ